MAKKWFPEGFAVVRSAIREDILFFAIPAFIIFYLEVRFCRRDGFSGFWGDLWGLVKQPQNLRRWPVHSVIGMALFLIGLTFLLVGQITLFRNYSSTLVIREDHQLITYGIYRFVRHPMYLGALLVFIGLPVYSSSRDGFLTSLFMFPIFLNRIRLEEKLLFEKYRDAYQKYRERTKKLIPFIY